MLEDDSIEEKKAEDLVKALLSSYSERSDSGLKEKFEMKLSELGLNQSQALEIMGIEVRALNAILTGGGSRVDLAALLKLAHFLDMPRSEVVKLFLESVGQMNNLQVEEMDKRKFISTKFDLVQLKKEGIIDSITDFKHIEEKLLDFFGYNSIFDYRKDVLTPAYSSAKLHKKNLMADSWIERVYQLFKRVNNPHKYDRQTLINYFPKIRWHSQNVENGLLEVIRALYKMGITVIYQPKFSSIHLRGATFAVNGKPCIVLTDYRGFYGTLWFALIHELHHVLFDWELIEVNTFHISDDSDLYTQTHIEDEANKFAREYLFPDEKMKYILPHIKDRPLVEEFAAQNHVHPNIIYIFYAFDQANSKVWASITKFRPDIELCLKSLQQSSWQKKMKEAVKFTKEQIFNT